MRNGKKAQIDIVREHLIANGRITSIDAFSKYNITRLSALIFRLRKEGKEIETIDKPRKNGGHYGVYILKGEK